MIKPMATNRHSSCFSPALSAALLTLLFIIVGVPASRAQASLDFLEGASIVADDGQFLGIVSQNSLNADSISNDLGKYGSSLSSTSIFNTISKYGSELSPLSPFNNLTTTPPKIRTKDNRWAYLTTNETLTPRLSPYTVIGWAKRGR